MSSSNFEAFYAFEVIGVISVVWLGINSFRIAASLARIADYLKKRQ